MDGYMNGWMDGWIATVLCSCCAYSITCCVIMPFTIAVLSLSCLLSLHYWTLQRTYCIHYHIHPPCDAMLSPIADNEFCQEVVYNELPPIKAKLSSGVAITETISCKEYQYYTMDGDAYY